MSYGVLCSQEEASCLIPNLITELKLPCPCEGREGLFSVVWDITARPSLYGCSPAS